MAIFTKEPQSWGRYPRLRPRQVLPIRWQHELPDLSTLAAPLLPYAYGRSYGDSCLNQDGVLLDISALNHLIAFDDQEGIVRCEAGMMFADILQVIVPRGWFLPVSPGTKFVSVGGAIANDVHGKNHHVAGTFGSHVTQFELLRSNGERLLCSPSQNSELFRATIGGLGLTGVILWAEFRLTPMISPHIAMESIRFESLDEFMAISTESDRSYDYTVSWVDLLVGGRAICRGKFSRGNLSHSSPLRPRTQKRASLSVPFDLPSFTLNRYTVKAFNELYYRVQTAKRVRKIVPYESFFYPLDSIHDWYRLYGPRGFLQYQFLVPFERSYDAMREVMGRIRASGEGSFLTVLKQFGTIKSPGMLSFPRPGLNLALDFSYRGKRTLRLLDELDRVVLQSGGCLYPAKDARMSAETFQTCYPQWKEFARYIDPRFSSSFWRRVTVQTASTARLVHK